MNDELDRHRREFLTGGLLNRQGARDAEDKLSRPSLGQASHFEQYTKNAMACEFELLLNLHQYNHAADAALKAFAVLDSVEQQMSIYRESSELSKLNQRAAADSVQVEPRLYHVLKLAQQINEDTRGAFDVTATPLSRVWGFDQRSGRVPSDDEIQIALARVGMQNLMLCDPEFSVRFLLDGVSVDLGGIGKGFAIDLATGLLMEMEINDFVFQGGQSSVAATGNNIRTEQGADVGEGWKIGLSHPTIPNCRVAEFSLINQCLGTSGTQRQGFFFEGRRFGHIIDPRTGYPTDHCLSATVVCSSAAIADALATAFFVMSLDDVQRYCDQHHDVAALLVYPDNGSGIQLETFNSQQLTWEKLV